MSRAKSDSIDWADRLKPLGDGSCGPSVPHDPVYAAIREARREDNPSLPQGGRARGGRCADWGEALFTGKAGWSGTTDGKDFRRVCAAPCGRGAGCWPPCL